MGLEEITVSLDIDIVFHSRIRRRATAIVRTSFEESSRVRMVERKDV